MDAGDGPRSRRWNRDGPQGRHEAPSPRPPPLLFVFDAERGGVLIVTDARRGRPLSAEQRQAVQQARELLLGAASVPEVAWIGPEGIAAAGRVEPHWLHSMSQRHPVVVLV
jgi:hypothetical protein